MELSEAWTSDITIEEIITYGTLLDDTYDTMLYKNAEDKVLCKLYYLKSRDLFALVRDTEHWSVITSQYTIDNLRHKYLNQELKPPVKDAFTEYDTSNFNSFQSDLDLNDIQSIKKYGRYLENLFGSIKLYYIEDLDTFAVFDHAIGKGYLNNSLEYRKKYNIPYQDERFSSFS